MTPTAPQPGVTPARTSRLSARPPRPGSTAWFTTVTALLTAAVTALQFLH